jgi:hypothetical protein
VIGILRPAAHRSPLPDDKVDATYRRLRLQVFLGIFVGYAGYYLVRKNFSLAMPYLVEQGYSKTDLGLALSGVSIAYGLSKFIMGSVSDRSNARVFMSLGLFCSALVMIVMGTVPLATSSVTIDQRARHQDGHLERCAQYWWWHGWPDRNSRDGCIRGLACDPVCARFLRDGDCGVHFPDRP